MNFLSLYILYLQLCRDKAYRSPLISPGQLHITFQITQVATAIFLFHNSNWQVCSINISTPRLFIKIVSVGKQLTQNKLAPNGSHMFWNGEPVNEIIYEVKSVQHSQSGWISLHTCFFFHFWKQWSDFDIYFKHFYSNCL